MSYNTQIVCLIKITHFYMYAILSVTLSLLMAGWSSRLTSSLSVKVYNYHSARCFSKSPYNGGVFINIKEKNTIVYFCEEKKKLHSTVRSF